MPRPIDPPVSSRLSRWLLAGCATLLAACGEARPRIPPIKFSRGREAVVIEHKGPVTTLRAKDSAVGETRRVRFTVVGQDCGACGPALARMFALADGVQSMRAAPGEPVEFEVEPSKATPGQIETAAWQIGVRLQRESPSADQTSTQR